MADQAALFEAMQSFVTRSVEDYDLDTVLEEVTGHAMAVLGLAGAGITLSVNAPGRPTQYIAATDLMTLHVEREQDRLQEGACVDSLNAGEPVAVADARGLQRWPAYKPVLLEAGFRAVAGIPMLAAARVVGALNAYSAQPREWTTVDVEAGTLLANMATAYIANAASYADKVRLADQLQTALDSRILVEQAKGMLAERYRITPDQAFEALRRHARNQRTKVQEIAVDVLTNRQSIEP